MKILLASLLALAAATAVQAEKSSEKSPLVTTEWLSKNLENPKVRIVEVSVEPGVYGGRKKWELEKRPLDTTHPALPRRITRSKR
jgi:3-mercaptopyruvate sulfurtransferase SseA